VTFFLGVFGASIPTVVGSLMGSGAQERQFLLDRRLAALQSYLVACNRAAVREMYMTEIFAEKEDHSQSLSARAQERQQRSARRVELRAREAVIAALFRVKAETLGLPLGLPPAIQSLTVKEVDDWIGERSAAADLRCAQVGDLLGQRLKVAREAEPIGLPPAA
jgi:hypothetical protein